MNIQGPGKLNPFQRLKAPFQGARKWLSNWRQRQVSSSTVTEKRLTRQAKKLTGVVESQLNSRTVRIHKQMQKLEKFLNKHSDFQLTDKNTWELPDNLPAEVARAQEFGVAGIYRDIYAVLSDEARQLENARSVLNNTRAEIIGALVHSSQVEPDNISLASVTSSEEKDLLDELDAMLRGEEPGELTDEEFEELDRQAWEELKTEYGFTDLEDDPALLDELEAMDRLEDYEPGTGQTDANDETPLTEEDLEFLRSMNLSRHSNYEFDFDALVNQLINGSRPATPELVLPEEGIDPVLDDPELADKREELKDIMEEARLEVSSESDIDVEATLQPLDRKAIEKVRKKIGKLERELSDVDSRMDDLQKKLDANNEQLDQLLKPEYEPMTSVESDDTGYESDGSGTVDISPELYREILSQNLNREELSLIYTVIADALMPKVDKPVTSEEVDDVLVQAEQEYKEAGTVTEELEALTKLPELSAHHDTLRKLQQLASKGELPESMDRMEQVMKNLLDDDLDTLQEEVSNPSPKLQRNNGMRRRKRNRPGATPLS